MKILVLNAGSSSLKFQLIDMETTDVLAKGNVEKINDNGSFLKSLDNYDTMFIFEKLKALVEQIFS